MPTSETLRTPDYQAVNSGYDQMSTNHISGQQTKYGQFINSSVGFNSSIGSPLPN